MANYTYESLADSNVQFLQGTQAQLNLYLPNAPATIPNTNDYAQEDRGQANGYKGHAVEGAFYLTTDTHRLYIGRKVDAVPNPNPNNVAIDDVYPEEISSGIATVADTGALNSIQTGGSAHDGDFYYIKDANILAVYEEDGTGSGSWQQINSPTGISSITQNFSSDTVSKTFSSSADMVKLLTKVATTGGEQSASIYLKAGDNVTLKPSTDNKAIEISSANSQSVLSVAEAAATTNKAPVVLSDEVNLDTKVYFVGVGANDTTAASEYNYVLSSDTSVNAKKTYYSRSGSEGSYTYASIANPTGNPSTSSYYERENIVKIAGPGINGTKVDQRNGVYVASTDTSVDAQKDYYTRSGSDPNYVYTKVTSPTGNPSTSSYYERRTGFEFKIEVKNGEKSSTRNAVLSGTQSILDPKITYGKYSNESARFVGGEAYLDIYTSAETESLINSKISSQLRNVDALHYKGTVASSIALSGIDDGTVEIGDVYKASADFNYDQNLVTLKIKTGDLLIATGTEGYALTSDSAINPYKDYYTLSGTTYTKVTSPSAANLSSYYEKTGTIVSGGVTWELVPSGNEPLLRGSVVATSSSNPAFGLLDANISANYEDLTQAADKLNKRPLYVTFDNSTSSLIKATSTGTADNLKISLLHTAPSSGSVTTVTASSPSIITTSTSHKTNDSLKGQNKGITFTAVEQITRDSCGHIVSIEGETVTLMHNYVNKITAAHSVNNNVGTIKISASDALGIASLDDADKGKIQLTSESIDIGVNSNNTALTLEVKWGNF